MDSSIPNPKQEGIPAHEQTRDQTLSYEHQLSDKSPETVEAQHLAPTIPVNVASNESAAASSTEGGESVLPSILEQPLQPIVETGTSQEVIQDPQHGQNGPASNVSETLADPHASPQYQHQPHVVKEQIDSLSEPTTEVNDRAISTQAEDSQQQPASKGGVNQDILHSTTQYNDGAIPSQVGDSQQEPARTGDENQEIPHPTYPTLPYTTGLDVDSNPTETDHSDADSAIGPSFYSSTFSTTSSVYEFVEENGRTYHRFKEGKYYLPNDEIEKDRLDLQHHLCNLSFESLYLAPIDTIDGGVQDVLDVATGTGIWAIEFAEQFPSAQVIGTDLSPVQPDYVPPNLHFEVDDAEDTWVYSHPFDYIHGRMLVTCFSSHLEVFRSAYNSLRPGGWIELQDASFPFLGADEKWNGSEFQRWMGLLMDGAKALGKDWHRVPKYKDYLLELGFEEVVEKRFNCPIGPWARGQKNKTLGIWGRANILQGLGGLSLAILTRGLGMTPQQIELLLVDVRKDINRSGSESLHLYAPMYVVYGRKPR